MALTKVETISFLENSFLDLQRLDLYKFVRLPIGSKMVEDMSWLKLADIEPEILTTRDFWLDGPKTRSGMEDVTRGEERRSTVNANEERYGERRDNVFIRGNPIRLRNGISENFGSFGDSLDGDPCPSRPKYLLQSTSNPMLGRW